MNTDDTSRAWRLVSVIQDLSMAETSEQVRDIVRHAARDLVDADGATFVLRDNGHCYYVDEDAISPLWKGSRFPMEMCISGWAMIHRESVVIPNVFRDDRIPHDVYRKTFVTGMAMVPIRLADPVGAIGVYWANERTASSEEMQLLQALADTTAVALEAIETLADLERRVSERTRALDEANARLLELSLTDDLTGLRNRRGFDVLADHEFHLSRRQNLPATVVYLDIDGLKAVNDSLGHEAGDAVIVEFAQLLRNAFRESDVIGRVGGDEFAVFMVATVEEGRAATHRLKRSLSRPGGDDVGVSVGVSAGIVDGSSCASLGEALEQADTQMYREKARHKRLAG